VPSGLAAIALVDQALLKQGDEVLLPDNVYGPSRELARTSWRAGASRTASTTRWTPAGAGGDDQPGHEAGLAGGAGSVTMEFPDLPAWCRHRARGAGVLTALDNTWGAGIAFDAFDLPSSRASTS
jgi:cystathionine beta-lyase